MCSLHCRKRIYALLNFFLSSYPVCSIPRLVRLFCLHFTIVSNAVRKILLQAFTIELFSFSVKELEKEQRGTRQMQVVRVH